MKTSDIMTLGAATAREDSTLATVLRLMHDYRIGAVPIVSDDGCLRGMVSEADFFAGNSSLGLAAVLLELEEPSRAERLAQRRADSIMQRDLHIISGDASLIEAARLIAKTKVARLPVVQNGLLVGMLSRTELLGFLAESTPPRR